MGDHIKETPMPEGAGKDMDVLEMVTDAERRLHEMGLRNMGIPEKTLYHIKALRGLASSSGHFIAQSLEITARSYYVQILDLMALAKRTHIQLMLEPGSPGCISDDEARAAFNKNYLEMVKEGGRAFELMLQGATVMVKMITDARGDSEPGGGKKRKPAWAIKAAEKTKEPPPSDAQN